MQMNIDTLTINLFSQRLVNTFAFPSASRWVGGKRSKRSKRRRRRRRRRGRRRIIRRTIVWYIHVPSV